jgi:hypothetical protein
MMINGKSTRARARREGKVEKKNAKRKVKEKASSNEPLRSLGGM